MTDLIVRKIKPEEMDDAYTLVRELAIYEKAEASFTIDIGEYHEQFKEGLFQILVAEHKGNIIGMALYYPTFSTWKGKMMYLEDFVVKGLDFHVGPPCHDHRMSQCCRKTQGLWHKLPNPCVRVPDACIERVGLEHHLN